MVPSYFPSFLKCEVVPGPGRSHQGSSGGHCNVLLEDGALEKPQMGTANDPCLHFNT